MRRERGSRYWVSGYPGLLAQWHPDKNADLLPSEVSYGSNRPIWWRCAAGRDHEWRVAPKHRTGRGRGCPFCAGRRVSTTNSLATLAPALAREWHPTKNGKLTPRDTVAAARKEVWWRCSQAEEHVWRARISNRRSRRSGCPYCSGLRMTPATALANRFPALVAEWDTTRNRPLTPRTVSFASHRSVWWRCPRDPAHRWRARIDDRTRTRGAGCPTCARGITSPCPAGSGAPGRSGCTTRGRRA